MHPLTMSRAGGAVYTRKWIADLMLDAVGYTPDKDLASVRVLEPSCGRGAFLIPIVHRLCESLDGRDRTVDDIRGSILAVDIDAAILEECRKEVESVLESYGFLAEQASYLSSEWLHQEDFLLNDYRGFDLVVGNPPYINSDDIPEKARRMYSERLDTVTMGTDLFVGFIENGLRSLAPGGRLCFICADRWMQNGYGRRLRGYITGSYRMEAICRMHGVDAFESDVSAYPAIMIIGTGGTDCRFAVCSDDFGPDDAPELLSSLRDRPVSGRRFSMSEIRIEGDAPWMLSSPDDACVVGQMISLFPSIEDSGVRMGIGVATGRDSVFITTDGSLVEGGRMLPLIKKEDIADGLMPVEPVHWLVNPWDEGGNLVDLDGYPRMCEYLESNSDSLRSRHVARKDASKWYRTIDKVDPDLLRTPKLLVPDLSRHPEPFYDEGRFYPSHNMYWMISDEWDPEVLGGVLLSGQVESFIDAVGVKMRGNTMRCQAQYLRMLHIPYPHSLHDVEAEGFRQAFRTRDRVLATVFMERLIGRMTGNGRSHEAGVAEVV